VKVSLSDLFEDDQLFGARVGRFSDAEEHMIHRLMTSNPLARWFSTGRDLRVPGYYSTRPISPEGRETFSFSHRNVILRTRREPVEGRAYCTGRAPKAAGLKYDRNVGSGGTRGCWYAPSGIVPDGFSPTRPVALSVGMRSGTASLHQAYIERFGAVEMNAGVRLSLGNIHENMAIRQQFWNDVEEREGAGGRVQSRLIADLPYEEEVGPEGRQEILSRLGEIFSEAGLPWHGVVHHPEKHSDPRNYHLHLLYHSRPVSHWTDLDEPVFHPSKNRVIHDKNWIRTLRHRYADIVNQVYEQAGLSRRWDPRSYREMGVAKLPGSHLGSAAMGLERKGVVTSAGAEAARREIASELMELRNQRIGRGQYLRARLEAARDELQPRPGEGDRVLLAKERLARAVADFSGQWWAREDLREKQHLLEKRRHHWFLRLNATASVPEFGKDADHMRRRLNRIGNRLERIYIHAGKRNGLRLALAENRYASAKENLDYERRRAAYMRARSGLAIWMFRRDSDGYMSASQKKRQEEIMAEEIRRMAARARWEAENLIAALTGNGIEDASKHVRKFEMYGQKEVSADLVHLFLPYETCLSNVKTREADLRHLKRKPSRPAELQHRQDKTEEVRLRELDRAVQALMPDWQRFQKETGIDLRSMQSIRTTRHTGLQ